MSLEDILKKTKAVLSTAKEDLWDRPDEWVRQGYQEIGDRFEEFLIKKYGSAPTEAAAIISMMLTNGLMMTSLTFSHNDSILDTYKHIAVLYGTLSNLYIVDNNIRNRIHVEGTSGEKYEARSPIASTLCMLRRTGLLLVGMGVVYYGFSEGTIETLRDSTIIFGTTSTFYFADKTPKKFKKDPFWKRAYDYLKEKAEEMMPQPEPVPVPVRRYAPLEDSAIPFPVQALNS